MIRLRFLSSYVGLGFAQYEGDEVDWRDVADAVRLIGEGVAEAVKVGHETAMETATVNPTIQTPEPPRINGKARAKKR